MPYLSHMCQLLAIFGPKVLVIAPNSTQAGAELGPGQKGLFVSVLDLPLSSVQTAGIPVTSALSSPFILEVLPPSCYGEASPVHKSVPEASPVHESAPEASPVHKFVPVAPEVAAFAAEPPEETTSTTELPEVATSTAEPVMGVAAIHELPASPVMTLEAVPELPVLPIPVLPDWDRGAT
ncbi:Cannabinoid receptor 1 [Labeo rohita]|uniref:Cannabinoid receptor 1 n=1 Tax=Labeo rohita TaxID=84645 RepID=A0ABQ8L961_LABRO|nr:Cannabinoid receptor 1 [Labeo rohita]